MSGVWSTDTGGPRLVLGIAIVLASGLPVWGLVLWMAASSVSWRWKAEKSWKRILVPVAMGAAVIGGAYVWTTALDPFISRSHQRERHVVFWVAMAQLLLAGIAIPVVAGAGDNAGTGTADRVHRMRRSRPVILAWGALALVLAALRAGPLGRSTPSSDWWALAGASGIQVMIMVLVIVAIVELRRDARGRGSVAPRSGARGDAAMSPSARGQVERSRPSPAVVVPALLLSGLVLVGAVLLFRQNLEQATSAGRWVGSTAFLLFSSACLWALLDSLFLGSRRLPQREYSGSFAAMSGPEWRGSDVIGSWRFTPRWKETLACASAEGEVVVEMVFIEPHVFFPTDDAWARHAPSWAKNRRAELLGELEQWCAARGVPLTVDHKAWVALP